MRVLVSAGKSDVDRANKGALKQQDTTPPAQGHRLGTSRFATFQKGDAG